ncbi:MAG: hypothetical protein QF437_17915 [Planctomycetota bacterium]|jgi:spore photoproduct lyase|nr:hypothetical protein [Planctomycetota bacterium]MDP7132375.1 hypothetical protein [Planctomycetota bacterium]MDP7252935.1 hypothetical protein [Planctomycetota bacterium]
MKVQEMKSRAQFDYAAKFESFEDWSLYNKLEPEQQETIRSISFDHRLTFEEFRQVVECCRDLAMQGEGDLKSWWDGQLSMAELHGRELKKHLLGKLTERMKRWRRTLPVYQNDCRAVQAPRQAAAIRTEKSDKKIYGMCPVASPKTVCCNLLTIDAVEHCVYGCSYCSIQTFYGKDIVFDEDFAEKISAIPIEPDRFYHFGSGQSSDSLAWGNRNGILDALCQFAEDHPNVLMEFKTKSDNVRYFLERDVPPNIVCSWSLNTPSVIASEEHLTPRLERRIDAARRVADRGIRVAFHFHPIIHYQGWDSDYPETARTVGDSFSFEEVAFISFGSLTMIKPVVRKIRELGRPTKILQMEQSFDPHGKLTYSDEIKTRLFQAVYESLRPWHGKVFFYLCMEKAEIWESVFGWAYGSNEEFEQDFGRQVMP